MGLSSSAAGDQVLATLALFDISVPPHCIDGVLANSALLAAHARIVRDADDPDLDPAEFLQI